MRVGAHAITGGIVETLQGGNFGNRFVSAGLTAATMPGLRISKDVIRTTLGALMGAGGYSLGYNKSRCYKKDKAMNIDKCIEFLERQWDVDGFLWQIRNGNFSEEEGDRFLSFLSEVRIEEDGLVPKRFVSLAWYLPSFLGLQIDRVTEKGGSEELYQNFLTNVSNYLEEILGVP